MKFEWRFTKAAMADEVFYVWESRGFGDFRKKAIFSGSDAEDEARGRLIAAAPEMLDGLQMSLKELTGDNYLFKNAYLIEKLQVLIAKATGELK